MKIKNFMKKLGRNNAVMKPTAVITASTPSVIYLSTATDLFNQTPIDGTDLVAVSKDLVTSLQGILILIMILISIMYIYKPPKLVMWMISLGAIMIFASQMFMTVGMTLLMYGLGLAFNSLTTDKLIKRNNLLNSKKLETEVSKILGETYDT